MKETGSRGETNEAVPQEPNLSDVLNDPIVMAVMRVDGVRPPGFSGSPSAARPFVQLTCAKERKRDERMFLTDD